MLTITIDTDNAAVHRMFEGGAEPVPSDGEYVQAEVCRILRDLCERWEDQRAIREPVGLRDLNGNRVGEVKVT